MTRSIGVRNGVMRDGSPVFLFLAPDKVQSSKEQYTGSQSSQKKIKRISASARYADVDQPWDSSFR